MRKRYCVDKGFKSLIPPLSEAERSQLEESCIKYGIKDSIKIWNLTIVDGHNRYEIAQKHKLPFKVDKMDFKSHEEAELWIVENQFGRRNLSSYDRCVLALKLKPSFIKRAKANQARTAENRENQKSDKQRMNTNKELAKIAGVSHDTIHKVDVIEKHGDKTLIEQIRNGDVSINEAYNRIKPPKKPISPKTKDVVVEFPVVQEVVVERIDAEEQVIEVPVIDVTPPPTTETVTFIETDESQEEVVDVDKDIDETAGLAYADDIMSGMTKIVNTVKYNRPDVVDRICRLNCEPFKKDEFKASLDECIATLIHLQSAMNGYTS